MVMVFHMIFVVLEKLVQRFNSAIVNTMYIAINEMDTADSQKIILLNLNSLKI